jgi:predicted enzyme related to lactoylglutathione lyase
VILAYRVDDIDSAVSRVGALGGVAGRIEKRPYGLAADFCTDDQGIRFHLLQLG